MAPFKKRQPPVNRFIIWPPIKIVLLPASQIFIDRSSHSVYPLKTESEKVSLIGPATADSD